MAEYRLYCFAQSGNAYKAELVLNLSGADWEPRFVDFFYGEYKTPEYRAINEMAEVPVLEFGERSLSQSGMELHMDQHHALRCSVQISGPFPSISASRSPFGCRPSRIASTISGARQVRGRSRQT
jgi:hypothetical protein